MGESRKQNSQGTGGNRTLNTVPAIAMNGVWFSYDGSSVLEDITFSLKQGDFLGMIGPNGGGKTTLIKLLLGILKPHRGTIRILGEEPHRARRRVGYVPQNTDFNNSFPISVMDVAFMGRLARSRLGKRFSSQDRPVVEEALRKVGMWDKRNAPIGKLSGGQRQRISLARALLKDAPVLLLDEPTSALDVHTEARLLKSLQGKIGDKTLVTVTHRISTIADADMILVLEQGRLAGQGTHQELLAGNAAYVGLCLEQDEGGEEVSA